MRSELLTLVVLLLVLSSCWQSDNIEEAEMLEDVYPKYDLQVGNLRVAELRQEDLLAIMQMFKDVPYAYARDIALALDQSIALGSHEQAQQLATMLLRRGCPKSYFSQEKFAAFRSSTYWNSIIDFSPEDVTFSPALREEIKSIYQFDQLLSRNFYNANIHPRFVEVKERFLQFKQRHGFPSEARTGLKMENNTTIGPPHYFVIMLHHYHLGYPLLWNELDSLKKNGEIDYRYADQYVSFMSNRDPEKILASTVKPNYKRVCRPKRPIKEITLDARQLKPVNETQDLTWIGQKEVVEVDSKAGFNLVFLDWNGDSLFNESNVDYFGLVLQDGSYSTFHPLSDRMTFLVDGRYYRLETLDYKVSELLPKDIGPEQQVVTFESAG